MDTALKQFVFDSVLYVMKNKASAGGGGVGVKV